MSGMADVNSASRPHYASSIPVPRAASQTRIHTPGASPQLWPRQAGLAPSPQRAASPRLGKATGPPRGPSPKASRGRGPPRASGGAKESAEGADGLCSSPWSSPRASPKAALSSPAGPRRGETQSPQGRRSAREAIPVLQTRSGSPSGPLSRPRGEAQTPGLPEGAEPPSCPGGDRRDKTCGSPGAPRPLEPEAGAARGQVQSRRPAPALGTVSFSSAHQQSQPVTATVAPFQYRLRTDQEPGPLPQGGWAADGYSSRPCGTEDSFSGAELSGGQL
ncbi:uncharacterized protein ENSP00000471857 [Pteropus alecto]|uniref:uncharacterized protein ENSP00000471857 n=1 Tax=Pteropus alecto TaxID=9402 RepID=UPI0007685E76|nr:uncharacterized protein ENSP00000471857 [Pteropus alecto]